MSVVSMGSLQAGDIFSLFSNQAVTVALATTRIAVAFQILPIFSNELVPALVRNAIFVALALVTMIVHPVLTIDSLGAQGWLLLFAKEILIGIAIGVYFGIFLWAFEAAGMVADTQIGTSVAQVLDPLSGHQTSLLGLFLGRLANYIFMIAGGLMLLTGVTMETYQIWPIHQVLPDFSRAGVVLFESEFSYFFQLLVLIASPIVVVVFLIDVVMGLVNRYAQQFNVFFISMSLKMLAAIAVLMLTMGSLIDLLISELHGHSGALLDRLRSLLG
ncbi:type III secretion system export apparatus subunit SctT [Thiolapillus sp.]